MALTQTVAAIVAALRAVPGIDQVPDSPPAQLGDARMLVVYPQPGDVLSQAHAGRHGGVVVEASDLVIVEFHAQVALNQMPAAFSFTVPMLDTVRAVLWTAFAQDRFGGTVTRLRAIRTDHLGQLMWNSQQTFGFRLVLDLSVIEEMAGGG